MDPSTAGRRPETEVGMTIFVHQRCAIFAKFNHAGYCALTGWEPVAGTTRTQLDLYTGTVLRYANSLLNMGVLVSPILAPMIGVVVSLLWLACVISSYYYWEAFFYVVDARNAPTS